MKLYPNEQQITQIFKDELDSARQYAKKLTLVNLADANSTNEMQNLALDDINPNGTSNNSSSANNSKTTNVPQASAYLAQQLANQTSRVDNQKVNLVKALIEIEDYATGLKFIDRLPQWFMSFNTDIATSVCKSLDSNFIDQMYRRFNLLSKYLRDKYSVNASKPSSSLSSSGGLNKSKLAAEDESSPMETTCNNSNEALLDDFTEKILPVLCSLGPGVSYNTVLFTKLIRIFTAFLDSKKLFSANSFSSSSSAAHAAAEKDSTPPPGLMQENGDSDSSSNTNKNFEQALKGLSEAEFKFYNSIYTILNEVLMPSLAMLASNPCLAIELWNLVKVFPYEMRYHIYNNWKLLTYKQFPNLIRARADCQEKIKYLLK